MAIDFHRMIQAAAEAALEGGAGSQPSKSSGKEKRHGLSVPRAFLIGAGLVTAGRLVAGSRGRDMLEHLQQRLVEYEHEHFTTDDAEEPSDDYDEEPEADFDEEEPEAEDEEPQAEEDEDFADEEPETEDEEPEAEEGEDFDEEDEEPRPPTRRRARAGSGSNGRRARR